MLLLNMCILHAPVNTHTHIHTHTHTHTHTYQAYVLANYETDPKVTHLMWALQVSTTKFMMSSEEFITLSDGTVVNQLLFDELGDPRIDEEGKPIDPMAKAHGVHFSVQGKCAGDFNTGDGFLGKTNQYADLLSCTTCGQREPNLPQSPYTEFQIDDTRVRNL